MLMIFNSIFRDSPETIQRMESIKDSASLRRSVKTLEDKYSTLSTNNQQSNVSIFSIIILNFIKHYLDV